MNDEIRSGERFIWNAASRKLTRVDCWYQMHDIGVKTEFFFREEGCVYGVSIPEGRLGVVRDSAPGGPSVYFAGRGNWERACSAFRLYFTRKKSELTKELNEIDVAMTFIEKERRKQEGGYYVGSFR